MAIKIPTAYEAGLGQKIPEAIPQGVATPVTSGYVDKGGVGTALGEGLSKIGGQLADFGVQEDRHNIEMQALNEHKLMQEQIAVASSKAHTDTIDMQTAFSDNVKALEEDQGMSIEEKKAAFDAVVPALGENFKKIIPPGLQMRYAPMLENHVLAVKSKFTESLLAQANDQQMANWETSSALLQKSAAEDPTMRQTAKDNAAAAIDALPISEALKVKRKQDFNSLLDSNEILNRQTVQGPNGFKTELGALLTDLQKTDENGAHTEYTGLDPKDRAEFIKTTQVQIHQDEQRRKADLAAQQAAFDTDMVNRIAAYKDKKLTDMPVSPQEENQLYKLTKGTRFEEQFQSIRNLGNDAGRMMEAYSKDPFMFLAHRLGKEPGLLNFNDPQSLPQAFADRIALKQEIQNHGFIVAGVPQNLDNVPFLTTDEIKGFGSVIEKNPKAGIAQVEQLSKMVGAPTMQGIAGQLSKTHPALATVMRYAAAGETLTAEAVASGQELLKTYALKMPKEDDLRGYFTDTAGDALNKIPNNAKEVYDAYKAAYAHAAQVSGQQDGILNKGLADIAFKQIVGGIAEINGRKVVLPHGATEDGFLNSIKHIDAGFVKQLGGAAEIGGGRLNDEDAARRIREDGQFYLAGNGLYRVLYNGLPLMTADHKKFIQFNARSLRGD